MDSLIHGMVEELKLWGHTEGACGHITLKSENEHAVKALNDAVWKLRRKKGNT